MLSILESADRQIAGEDPDELRPTDFVTADMLAARQVPEHLMSVAERAAADRDWRYGHLVVDEAQELSAMDWHVLLRRCPSRSITAVGDLAQRSAAAGAQAWADVLVTNGAPGGPYRTIRSLPTPNEIMDLAAAVLADSAPDRQPPGRSVRPASYLAADVPAGELAARGAPAVERSGANGPRTLAGDRRRSGRWPPARAAAQPGGGKGPECARS